MTNENKQIIKRLVFSLAIIVLLALIIFLLLKHFGLTNLSREQIQVFIKNKGVIAPLIFIFISFMQVTLIPIPGTITILAGIYLFGVWESFIYSYIGTFSGAIVAFAMGRLIGKPYVNWVTGGREKTEQLMDKLNGRENVFLFFAFLLPLFPDDILCAIAGALPIKWFTFTIMQVITRATSILGIIFFMSGEIIPFYGWGLIVIIVGLIIGVVAFVLSLIYSKQINGFFIKIVDKILKKENRKTEK